MHFFAFEPPWNSLHACVLQKFGKSLFDSVTVEKARRPPMTWTESAYVCSARCCKACKKSRQVWKCSIDVKLKEHCYSRVMLNDAYGASHSPARTCTHNGMRVWTDFEKWIFHGNVSFFHFMFVVYFPPEGEGRSRRQCNTGPTRGGRGASPCKPTRFQKSVNLEGSYRNRTGD